MHRKRLTETLSVPIAISTVLRPTAWVVFFVALPCCYAQQETPASLTQLALKAYQTKDYASFLTLEKRALVLAPGEPRSIYNVACGEALVGHPAESVRQLDQLLKIGLDLGADKDADFNGIRKTPEWTQFEIRLALLRKPMVRSTIAFTLPEAGLVATTLALDEQTGDTYIGSARARKVLKRTKEGVVSDFVTERDGLQAVSFLLIDPVRRQLIVSTGAVPFMQGFRKEDTPKTGIMVFDLSTRKALRSVLLPESKDRHLLSEMVEDKRGNLFVVDSASSEIYRLRPSSSELELFLSSVVFRAPQSLALSDDGRTMYVVDYIQGLWVMEVLSIDRRHVDAGPEVFVAGLLGLARTPDGFVGVQHGVEPNRVVRVHLDAKEEHVVSIETLESNHPDYAAPSQGIVSGGNFFYIANTQVGSIDAKTGLFPIDLGKPTIILRLPLGN